MNKIVICIPTYKRPEMLKKLVMSILECSFNKSLIREVNIIIVDNDAGRTAESAVKLLKEKYNSVVSISYINYSVKGLSNVRNELLRNGLQMNPDFLIFVDDDEFVTPEWLDELVHTITANHGDIAMGPVNSLVSRNIPKYISCWLDRQHYLNNTKLDFIRTGNIIIRVKSLLEFNVWFDPRFNTSGGEDSFFGIQMIKKGASIYWASKAVACESVPDERANIKWLFKRYYNGANIYAYILKVERNYLKILKKLFVSALYVFSGICTLILIPITFEKRYWGIFKIAEGCGGIAGLLSLRYEEYK